MKGFDKDEDDEEGNEEENKRRRSPPKRIKVGKQRTLLPLSVPSHASIFKCAKPAAMFATGKYLPVALEAV